MPGRVPGLDETQSQPAYLRLYQKHWQSFADFIPPAARHGPEKDHVTTLLEKSDRTSGDTHRHGVVRTVGPQEVRAMTRKHLDGKCIVVETLESQGKRVKRVIPLTAKALVTVERLCGAAAGDEPILKNTKRRP